MKVKVHLHPRQNTQKPEDAREINNVIPKYLREIEVEELADKVGNKGQTLLPAVVNGRRQKKKFVQQQIFALDFDNTISKDEFMERAKRYDILPVFLYDTLSCEDTIIKFRAVYINDIVVVNVNTAEIILGLLMLIYPEADVKCKDAVHMYFGGKNLFYLNTKNTINLFDLAISAQACFKNRNYKNYSRDIDKFAKANNIKLNENVLCIHVRVNNDIEEFKSSSNIIMESDQNSSKIYVIEKTYQNTLKSKSLPHKKPIAGVKENNLLQSCQLCLEFYDHEIEHGQKFLIATNLLQLKGGKSLFFNGHIEHEEKWKTAWNYIKAIGYQAQRCTRDVCPYCGECNAYSIVDKVTSNIVKVKEYEYIPLEDAEKLLAVNLEKSVYDESKDIDLIVAQTALGKTWAYSNLIASHKEEKFMVAVPTNKLQKEVAEELRKKGVQVYMTPNIKEVTRNLGLMSLNEEINYLYNQGYGLKVKETVADYCRENENVLSEGQKYILDDYFKMKCNIGEAKCVVTTHAMLLGLEPSLLQQFRIIVDEDILMTIFKGSGSISFNDLLDVARNKNLDKTYGSYIYRLMGEENGSVISRELPKLNDSDIRKISQCEIYIEGSIIDFLQADEYYIDRDKKVVNYFVAKEIPKLKLTIVSATADEELYRGYCKNRRIRTYEIPNAKYMGTLYQYTAYSMSRTCLKNMNYSDIKKCALKLCGREDMNSITFKDADLTKEIYYGKTEGYNEYKGNDLLLIGTPHNPPFVYKLLGHFMGYDTSSNMQSTYVEHKEYRFKFMTFKDEKMRMLQFYFIESELEQAVGRARLLRFQCNVHLFSNFPLRQAVLMQDKFMKEKETSVPVKVHQY